MHTLFFAALRQRPALLNSITGCILFAGSDALAQKIEVGDPLVVAILPFRTADAETVDVPGGEFNYRRFVTSGVLGIFFGGFVYPKAYGILDRRWPGVGIRQVVTKSLVEIATVGIFVNSVSMAARGILVGRPKREVARHVAGEMPYVTVNDFRVWMPYNLIAFGFIPAFIRPTTTAMMEASWQTYISLRSHDYHVHRVRTKQAVAPGGKLAANA